MITKQSIGLFTVLTCCHIAAGRAQAESPQSGEQVELRFATSDSAEVPYLLYLPKGYDESEKAFPLVFFLHGRGESNGPLSLVAKWGPPMMAERGDELPFILVSPQCPTKDSWSSATQQKRLAELLDSISKSHRIDQTRVYLTGLSMGGYGSWRMAADHPERFAAVVPICGGGDPKDAPKLINTPIWAFHGVDDSVVPFEQSQKMVDAIQAAGGTMVRLTSLEHINHNSWSATYATPELFHWMLSHNRKE
ncbi:esterase [Planctomycetes bacterium CA13]|uniref:Esterase n=1 Tax=Novipirellula herctigrandis TaxID=2527986 RepID=A0A5C5Z1R9_9BACT|nr:esterase [Planctomycetes bacterium CA13]